MATTLKTRKPVGKLTASDFRAFPVWEYVIDEEGDGERDETWVRPVEGATLRNGVYSQLVAADFVTPTGRKLQGFMIVTTAERQVEITPGAVVGAVGYQALPLLPRKVAMRDKALWDIEARDRLISALSEPEEDVFPLQYTLRVMVRDEKESRTDNLR